MTHGLPVACTLTPDALAARRAGLLRDLVGRASSRDALPSGWRFLFPGDGETLIAIARTVDAERQCCRFLRFEIAVEPDGGPISLVLTGPSGTAEFLASLFEP